jgi:hypothetical protein
MDRSSMIGKVHLDVEFFADVPHPSNVCIVAVDRQAEEFAVQPVEN